MDPRGRTLFGRLTISRRPVAVLAAVWLIGLVAVFVEFDLQRQADSRKEAQLVIGQMHIQINALPQTAFDAGPTFGSTPARQRAQLAQREEQFDRSLARLERFDHDRYARQIESTADPYFATIDRMLRSVAAGDLERAGAQLTAAARPGGSGYKLERALTAAQKHYAHDASTADTQANVGSILTRVFMLLLFSTTFLLLTRSRRGSMALADDNRRLLDESRRNEERYHELFENANEPIATLDLEGRFTDLNAAFARALDYPREELIGTCLDDHLTPESSALSQIHRGLKRSGQETDSVYEQELVDRSGKAVTFETSSRVIVENGLPVGVQGICRNVTERKEREVELVRLVELNRHQALHDPLTGLPNRAHFSQRIDDAIAAGCEFATVMVDLDRFKEVNDTLGHRSGDELLQELTMRLSTELREPDTVARLGGDEFGVLLLNVSETREGWARAIGRIKAIFEKPALIQGLPVSVEASMGIAFHPAHGADADLLLQHADIAMYVAKNEHRGHSVYDPGAETGDTRRLTLLGDLRRALADRELVLHYQPKVDLRTDEVARVEALVRWQHPEHGLIPPVDFIPLAERTGLIRPLTLYVLEEAVLQCKRWELAGRVVSLAVNLSAANLTDPELVGDISRILAAAKFAPQRLLLEITESAIIADPIHSELMLRELSALGIKLAIDDFGSGYTSLAYLARLPVDQIKIDRSFVGGVVNDRRDLAIVRSIIDLGHDLGLEVVAEGVETRDILENLRGLNCDFAQGYYLGRPQPVRALTAWFDHRRRDETGTVKTAA